MEAAVQGRPSSAALRSYHWAALASKAARRTLPPGKRGREMQGLGAVRRGVSLARSPPAPSSLRAGPGGSA